jgi:hypothetical protein
VFDKLTIWPQISAGATRVEWTLVKGFKDTGIYTFQVQVGTTGSNLSDDWVDVGTPVVDTYFKLDTIKRLYGKFAWTHYRIKLTTDQDTYYSHPQSILGTLDFHRWNRARELVRLESLRLKHLAGQEGYLLKRKHFGTACSCLDPQTQEVLDAQHDICYGTGIVGGYYEPIPCFYVEQSRSNSNNNLDAGQMRGTIDDSAIVTGRMINIPQIYSMDVWVDRDTDKRWLIRGITNLVEVQTLPLVLSVEMRLLPYGHPVYKLVIDGQIPS